MSDGLICDYHPQPEREAIDAALTAAGVRSTRPVYSAFDAAPVAVQHMTLTERVGWLIDRRAILEGLVDSMEAELCSARAELAVLRSRLALRVVLRKGDPT